MVPLTVTVSLPVILEMMGLAILEYNLLGWVGGFGSF